MVPPSGFARTTERFAPSSLSAEALAELDGYQQQHGVELDLGAVRAAVRTLSEAPSGGLLRRKRKPMETIALATPEHLIVIVGHPGDQDAAPAILVRRLAEADVADRMGTLGGLEITGFPPGGSERGTAFLPLEDNLASREFVRALGDAGGA